MNTLRVIRHAFSIFTIALLAACSGSQPPIGAPGAMPQSGAIAPHAARGGSWMLPEAKNGELLYLADARSANLSVYSFPGLKLVGEVQGVGGPFGECTDTSGDVYVVNTSEVLVYTHGGTSPIRTIPNPDSNDYFFWSCSADSSTGALAVTAQGYAFGGYVYVYQSRSGSPTPYFVGGQDQPGYCTYDGSGNLFVLLAPVLSYPEALVELRSGATKFRAVHLSDKHSVNWSGGAQWIGDNLALSGYSSVMRFIVKQSQHRAVLRDSVALSGSSNVRQFWIGDKRIVVPSIGSDSFNIYSYPAAKEIATIAASGEPTAAVVSVASNR
jgi:hypothetical protein